MHQSCIVVVLCLVVAACWATQLGEAEQELGEMSLLQRTIRLLEEKEKELDTRAIICRPGTFPCGSKGRKGCIPNNYICNGRRDCPNGIDELICSWACPHMTSEELLAGYVCADDQKCITAAQKCDKTIDCPRDVLEGTAALGCSTTNQNDIRDLVEEYLDEDN